MSAPAAALVLLASAGCQPAPLASAPLPAGPRVVRVDMAEYRFVYEAPAAAGRVLLRVRNTGRVPHTLTVIPLPDDIPPIKEQLAGTERRGIDPFAGTSVQAPGASTSFAVDLAPGVRYAFVCFLGDAAGPSHATLGMASEFRTSKG